MKGNTISFYNESTPLNLSYTADTSQGWDIHKFMGPATILESHKSNIPTSSAIVNDGNDFTADSSYQDIINTQTKQLAARQNIVNFLLKNL